MTDLRALVDEIKGDPAPLNAYHGRSLADAFAAMVLRDARFWDATRAVLGRTVRGMTCSSGGLGLIWPSHSGLWPARPWPLDLMAGWLDPEVITHGIEVDSDGVQLHKLWAEPVDELEPIQEAAEVVTALLARFLAPLQEGYVTGSGHAAAGRMALMPISAAVWSQPASLLDVVNSGIARWTGYAVSSSEERRFRLEVIVDEFRAVTLDVNSSNTTPAGSDTSSKKHGRPRELSYDIAMDAIWARIHREGLPESGAALCKMLEDEFQRIDQRVPERSTARRMLKEREPSLYRYLTSRAVK